jgi:alpha-L-fucosidase 2
MITAYKKTMVTFVFFSITITVFAQNNNLKLWYNKPTGSVWEQALPIGNGRLAGMVYSNPERECIKLNEATVWSGGPNRNDSPTALSVLSEVRKLIFEGKNKEAAALAAAKMKTTKINGMCYQPVGNLYLNFPGHDHYENYYRELDLAKAVVTTSYTVNGTVFKREVFTSIPDQVIMIHLTASKPASLSFMASMFSPQRSAITTKGNDELVLSGISGDKDSVNGMVKFQTLVKIKTDGGTIAATDTAIAVNKANEVTVFVSIATNFVNYKDLSADQEQRAAAYLNKAQKKSYAQLLNDHVAAYQKYFNRVRLDLGTTDSIKNPTDIRIAGFANDNDPQLAALYFQFGRYLLISSSQPGGQPANLQGIWNDKMNPPWGSKYTINVNTEMNYWPAEETNLSEMAGPLIQMVKELSITGRETAKVMYGADGWVTHHNTDLWRITGPVDGIYSGLWPSGGIWLSRHLWERYLYSGDKAYLQFVYGTMKGAAQFCLDFLTEEPEHKWLVMSPSLSPENGPRAYGGVSVDAGVTMDNQLVFELFSNVIRAASVLNTDKELVNKLIAARKRLPPMHIGQYGQLQEWLHDLDNPEDKNRHVSHLFGLYPGNQISPYRTPELFDAARTSLIFRSDISTGWSMGWKVNLWARLLDGNHAFKLIKNQLTPAGLNKGPANSGGGTYPNMFDAHPPFQIDGNFGCTAGIAEMLLQSYDGNIYLLPAIPNEWATGSVSGLKARGGFEIVSMQWKDGRLARVELKSVLGGNCRIRVAGPLKAEGSFALKVAKGKNTNFFYQNAETALPVIAEKAKLNKPGEKETILYDFVTQAGKVYTLVSN